MTSEAGWSRRRLHFVGIGGTGMRGLAAVCASLGARVSGSDRAAQGVLTELSAAGICVTAGHAPENVPEDAELVYSSAVKADNVERVRARALGLRELRRGELLAELATLRRCIAIAGTHGKTTTAAMTVHALAGAGITAGYVIGAGLRDGSPSARWTAGEWLIVEADESDRTFLGLRPEIAVVTNIALEHVNEYASLGDLEATFAAFMQRADQVVTSARVRPLCADRRPVVFEPREVHLGPGGSCFRWHEHAVRLTVPGAHNALNATGALEACRLAGAEPAAAVAALADYPGAERRIEPVGASRQGARIYEDYAVHANEVRATLAALRTIESGRVIAVFEPLLFSRTRQMASALGAALVQADAVVVLELFAGSEHGQSHPGITGRLVADAVAARAGAQPVAFEPTIESAAERLRGMLGAGDACVIMGVSAAAHGLARCLVERQ